MRRSAHAVLALIAGLLIIACRAAPANAADDDRPVVKVGTEGTYPPFSFHDPDSDQLTGYDIDVIKAVAKQAGWKLKFVETQWDAIFPALDSKRIDVIANQVSVNAERQARYGLSEPYTYSQGVIITRADDDDITTLADLDGKTTAQSSTSNWAGVARDAGAKVEAVEGFAQAAALLEQGRVDAIVNDNIAVLDYLATTGSKKIKIAGSAADEVSKQALTFRKADKQLLQEANQAMQQLRADGTLRKISEKYFKAEVSIEGGGDASLEGRGGRSGWDVVKKQAWPMFVGLVKVSIPLTAVSFIVGLVVALLVALARISASRWLSWPARTFISIIRGTPLLVQLFIVFYGLPQIGVELPGVVGAVLTLSLNVAGYAAEIIRSAILSVPKGQTEAARTIGLDYRQTLRRIVLPQALRTAVPPLSNTLVSLLKDTSLVSILLLNDLFRRAQVAAGESSQFLPLYILAAVYYWIVCWLLSGVQRRLETRLSRYQV